jgi:hypothetical protein
MENIGLASGSHEMKSPESLRFVLIRDPIFLSSSFTLSLSTNLVIFRVFLSLLGIFHSNANCLRLSFPTKRTESREYNPSF